MKNVDYHRNMQQVMNAGSRDADANIKSHLKHLESLKKEEDVVAPEDEDEIPKDLDEE